MIFWKKGVLVDEEPRPPIRHAIMLAAQLYDSWFDLDLFITSYVRQEDIGSLHSQGLAVDFRLPSYFSGFSAHHDKSIRQQLHHLLGSDYDVVLEDDHIHVEYDPKP